MFCLMPRYHHFEPIIYDQEALRFHFAMGRTNDFAGPAYITRVLLGYSDLP